MFKLRKMKHSDKDAIVEICSKIWDGDDYLPAIFDEWVESKSGEFTAAELNGKVVGAAKCTFVAPGHAWLEGLRKDIDLKEKGLGYEITKRYFSQLAKYKGLKTVRFATYFGNIASIKLNEKMGFRRIVVLSVKFLDLEDEKFSWEFGLYDDVFIIKDLDKVWDYIQKTGYFNQSKKWVTIGWVCYPLSKEFIQEMFIDNGRCVGIVENNEIVGLALWGLAHYPGGMCISMLEANNDQNAKKLFDHLMQKAQADNFTSMESMIPDHVKKYFAENSFVSWEKEADFWIYDLPLEKLKDYE